MSSLITTKTQLRVFVPMHNPDNDVQHTEWQEYLCNTYGGFSVNPSELIESVSRNPATGNVAHKLMAVYYVWVNEDDLSMANVEALGDAVRRIYGETSASVIIDHLIRPRIVG